MGLYAEAPSGSCTEAVRVASPAGMSRWMSARVGFRAALLGGGWLVGCSACVHRLAPRCEVHVQVSYASVMGARAPYSADRAVEENDARIDLRSPRCRQSGVESN